MDGMGGQGLVGGQISRILTRVDEWRVVREQAGSAVGHGGEAAKQNDQLRCARQARVRL